MFYSSRSSSWCSGRGRLSRTVERAGQKGEEREEEEEAGKDERGETPVGQHGDLRAKGLCNDNQAKEAPGMETSNRHESLTM